MSDIPEDVMKRAHKLVGDMVKVREEVRGFRHPFYSARALEMLESSTN